MEGRALLQYLIDISDVQLAKKQEATEYLAKLEKAAQHSVQPTCSTCGAKIRPGDVWWNECEKCHSKIANG